MYKYYNYNNPVFCPLRFSHLISSNDKVLNWLISQLINMHHFYNCLKGAANLRFTNNWWKSWSSYLTGWLCVGCLPNLWFYLIALGINLENFLLKGEEDPSDYLMSCPFSVPWTCTQTKCRYPILASTVHRQSKNKGDRY